jgi:hypothetical protein
MRRFDRLPSIDLLQDARFGRRSTAIMGHRRFFALALALALLAVAAIVARPGQARAAEPQKLFALDAKQGALAPLAGKPDMYRLVLEGVRARAIYFTDRPEREVGTVAVRPMLRRLFANDSPAPNAAVNASAAKRGQLLMGIEISGWHYDAGHRKLTLRILHLPQGGRTIGHVREDVVLPRSFRDVSVFIDDCCSVVAPATAFNTGIFPFTLSINNGPQVEVRGASRETWLPGSAPIIFETGEHQQGVLGPGVNFVSVTPTDSSPFNAPIALPNSIQYDTVQLYISLEPYGFNWMVLNSGQMIASGHGQ